MSTLRRLRCSLLMLPGPALACSGEGAADLELRLTVFGLTAWLVAMLVAASTSTWAWRRRGRRAAPAALLGAALANPCVCFNPGAGDCGMGAAFAASAWLVLTCAFAAIYALRLRGPGGPG